jgi:hypothetical protein
VDTLTDVARNGTSDQSRVHAARAIIDAVFSRRGAASPFAISERDLAAVVDALVGVALGFVDPGERDEFLERCQAVVSERPTRTDPLASTRPEPAAPLDLA